MSEFQHVLTLILGTLTNYWELIATFLPIMLIVEVPLLLFVFIGVLHWSWKDNQITETTYPPISFIITCYSEGHGIEKNNQYLT